MNRTTRIVALAFASLAVMALSASTASADHFARQRQESLARVAAAQHQLNHGHSHGVSNYGSQGHWGGPTTNHRYYHPSQGYGGYGVQQNVQFYPVNPYGYGRAVAPYGCNPYYGAPSYGAGGSGFYLHIGR